MLELQVFRTMFDMYIFIHFTATQCQFQAGSWEAVKKLTRKFWNPRSPPGQMGTQTADLAVLVRFCRLTKMQRHS